jgi:hypothetical protein
VRVSLFAAFIKVKNGNVSFSRHFDLRTHASSNPLAEHPEFVRTLQELNAKGHSKLSFFWDGVIEERGEYGVRRQRQRPLLDDEPAIAVSPPDIGFYVSP